MILAAKQHAGQFMIINFLGGQCGVCALGGFSSGHKGTESVFILFHPEDGALQGFYIFRSYDGVSPEFVFCSET